MASEKSSLEIDADFNLLELRLEQRPLLGWAALIHVLNLGTFIPGVWSGATWVMVFTVPFFIFAAAFFVMGLAWTRPATFRVQATQLVVKAWTGRLARPREYRLPLDGLSLAHEKSGAVNKRAIYRLLLTPEHGETIHVGALACTEADLDRLTAEVAAVGDHARNMTGLGTAEVPAALHSLRHEAHPDDR